MSTSRCLARLRARVVATGPALLILTAATGAMLLAACSKDDSASTPLPTREKTIGRVEQSLQKADEEAAKRRAEIDNATK